MEEPLFESGTFTTSCPGGGAVKPLPAQDATGLWERRTAAAWPIGGSVDYYRPALWARIGGKPVERVG